MIYRLFKKYIDREVDKRVCENAELEFLKSMRKLEVKDGDLIIVEHPEQFADDVGKEVARRIGEMFLEFGYQVKVLFVAGGISLSSSHKTDTGLSYVVDNDSDFLKWIWARLNYMHGESPDSDYMHKLLEMSKNNGYEEWSEPSTFSIEGIV